MPPADGGPFTLRLTDREQLRDLDQVTRSVKKEFHQLEQKIVDAIVQAFRSLPITAKGIDLGRAGIKGPSSTWTYLITNNQFGFWVGLLHGSNIGSTATAAAVYAPLYLALGLVQRYWKNKGYRH